MKKYLALADEPLNLDVNGPFALPSASIFVATAPQLVFQAGLLPDIETQVSKFGYKSL